MSCKTLGSGGASDPKDCKCHKAVLNAFTGLIDAGEPEQVALEAAKIVYSYHHPEDSNIDAALIVERWVFAEHFH